MSALAGAIVRLESVGDRCNAILVKEVRQALKSRQFVGTFTLLLLAAWGGSVFVVTLYGDSLEYGSSASGFFDTLFWILCIACLVAVPFTAFRSIVEERSENTLELVQITALSPRQIVQGKTLSAFVQVLVYYSAIAPFMAFTALLPGFDFVQVAFSLLTLLVASMCFTSAALAIGAQTRQKVGQAFASIGVVVLGLIGWRVFAFAISAAGITLSFKDPNTWWGLGFIAFIMLSTAYLCQQVAVAQLTFDSDNRSSGIRLTMTAQWLVSWLALLAYTMFHTAPPTTEWAMLVIVTGVYLTATGLYLAAESDRLSRRVSRGLPRSRLVRLIWTPFMPGGTRGFLFALCSITVFLIIAGIVYSLSSPGFAGFGVAPIIAIALLCYGVIYLGIGTYLARLFRRVVPNFSAVHIYVLVTLLGVLAFVLELLLRYFLDYRDGRVLVTDVFNPVRTIETITRNRNAFSLPPLELKYFLEWELLAGVIAAIAINGKALVRSISDVVNNPVRAEIEREAARREQAQLHAAQALAAQALAAQTTAAQAAVAQS